MRFSLIGMLGLVTVISIALALGQFSPAVSGFTLMSTIAVAWLIMPTPMWRRLAYGSVIGSVIAFFLLSGFVAIQTGRWNASNYQESNEMRAISKPWTPYVIPVGALVGSIVAISCKRWPLSDVDSVVS